MLTKRNMQKLTCYTRWPSQWQLSATCLPLLCSAYMSIGSASKFRLPDFTCCLTQTKIKINQLENILNLIGQDVCNSIWLREGPETVRRPSLNIFLEHVKADLNWSACVSEHHCLCEAIKAQKKNHSPSDFRPPTRDGGDCYENSPVGLFRLKLLILENILQLWEQNVFR